MFDVMPDDIANLDDDDLRELVARLAAAELARYGQSPLAVTAGGHQDAPDDGLDVHVGLKDGVTAGPNIPRNRIGYQVKKPDMPRAKIRDEMRPGGVLRPVIADLAAAGGAYIIVSSKGSTAHGPLQDRRAAMREALADCPHAAQLDTDFYDRTRIANWVRQHPGLIVWTREKSGRAIAGWKAFANWSNPDEPEDAEYLIDDRVRIRFEGEDSAVPVLEAITRLREMVRHPGRPIRLVGLSGVGKTRFIQALFDPRVCEDSQVLPKNEVVYTDFNESSTIPQPEVMAGDLIVQQRQAILIIDNCGGELHARLAKQCKEAGCSIRLLTVEYDVQGEEPENTRTVEMETASESLIEELLNKRHPRMARENVGTIAHVSGGNARIALAIAETVRRGDKLAGLPPGTIFDRLFQQRKAPDDSLLRAAEVCSLLYSFDVETAVGNDAELPVMSQLSEIGEGELYRHIQEMRGRGLVQSRSRWRAILPHALANHLAGSALRKIRPHQLRRYLVEGSNARLLLSFTHRLSYLHDSPVAVGWCQEFLRQGGILGQLLGYTQQHRLMFTYVAPVAPAAALDVMARAANEDTNQWLNDIHSYTELLRLIAWDGDLFGPCIELLASPVRANRRQYEVDQAQNILVSFFKPKYSGTHATVSQRYALISQWLNESSEPLQRLGKRALAVAMSAQMMTIGHYNFGARRRDSGYMPQTSEDFANWFKQGLALLKQLAKPEGLHSVFARETLVSSLPGLWVLPSLRSELAQLLITLAAGTFWCEAWLTVRRTLRYGPSDAESVTQLRQLERTLEPKQLPDRIIAAVQTVDGSFVTPRPGEDHTAAMQRDKAAIEELGIEATSHLQALRELAPVLITQPGRTFEFGIALAQVENTRQQIWDILTTEWARIRETSPDNADTHFLRGFLFALACLDRAVAEQYVEQCAGSPVLAAALPGLQAAIGFNLAGLGRIEYELGAGNIPLGELIFLGAAANCASEVRHAALALLIRVAQMPEGSRLALDAIQPYLNLAEQKDAIHDSILILSCQSLLENLPFTDRDSQVAYSVFRTAQHAIQGERASTLAGTLATRMVAATRHLPTLPVDYEDLTQLILKRAPEEVLTALCNFDPERPYLGTALLEQMTRDGKFPLDQVAPELLATWCSTDPSVRTTFALRVIPAVANYPESGNVHLTRQALAVMQLAPDREDALAILVDRIRHQSLGHSRGARMEHNAVALDDLLSMHDANFQAAVRRAQSELREAAADRIRMENDRARQRNEVFEPSVT